VAPIYRACKRRGRGHEKRTEKEVGRGEGGGARPHGGRARAMAIRARICTLCTTAHWQALALRASEPQSVQCARRHSAQCRLRPPPHCRVRCAPPPPRIRTDSTHAAMPERDVVCSRNVGRGFSTRREAMGGLGGKGRRARPRTG
jgi:hypothetical protein